MKTLKYLMSVLLTYYLSAVVEQRLFILDTVIKDDVAKKILTASWKVIVLLLLINIILILIDDMREQSKKRRYSVTPIYNEVCKYLYEKHIAPITGIEKFKPRVSIHKGIKNTLKQIRLINVGRHQHTSPWQLSRIKYCNNEGCAGMCFHNNMVTTVDIEKEKRGFFKYLLSCKSKSRLSIVKALFLHEKSTSIISIPILDRDKRPWGVITIDSLFDSMTGMINPRDFENSIKEFAFIFSDREVL